MSEVAPGVGWLSDVSEGNCGGVIREMGWVWAGGYSDVQEEYNFYIFIHNLISPAFSCLARAPSLLPQPHRDVPQGATE